MSIEKNIVEKEKVVKQKKKFFGCKSKVFVGLFLFAIALDFLLLNLQVDGMQMLGLPVGLIGFIFMLVCVYKDINKKKYGVGKKIAVWIWDIVMSFIIVGLAITLANQAFGGYMSQHLKISCDASTVQTNVKNVLEGLLLENKLISSKEIAKAVVTFSDVEELNNIQNRDKKSVECRATVRVSNIERSLIYTIDYNSTYYMKSARLQSEILLRDKN